MSGSPFRVFISYSHKDEKLRAGLDEHLSQLRRDGAIESWTDHKIRPGQEWEKEIFAALEAADVVLLLVSSSFIASDFCYSREMTRAVARHDAGSARVVPVILRPCDWKTAPFAKLQSLPATAKPVTEWSNRDKAFLSVAEGIRGMLADLRPKPGVAQVFSVPFQRNPYFTGREDVLAEIATRLEKVGQAAVSGLGGIGKTQTAVEFAYRHRDRYRAVFFVRAETAGEILTGFAEIANRLSLVGQQQDQNAAASATRQWLETHGDWLLIFDNADEPAVLEQYLPAAGHVLVTSRAPDFSMLSIQGKRIAPLSDQDALGFLLKRTARQEAGNAEKSAAAELTGELGNLPLALEQAAAYLVEHGDSFATYLKTYRKKGLTLFKGTKPQAGTRHDPLAVTWSLNFQAVRRASRASADLLNAVAFLAPDAIPDELFLHGGAAISPAIAKVLKSDADLAVGRLAAPLLRYSLLERDPEARTLRVHRLVQETVRENQGTAGLKTVQSLVTALRRSFPWPEYEEWWRCERLLQHVFVIAKSADEGDDLVWLLNASGIYLWERARFAEAESQFARALAINENALPGDHPSVATSLHNLGILYWDQGRLAEARRLCERALAIREKVLETDDPEIAASLNSLAGYYLEQGDFVEAESLFERALAIWEKSFGSDHPAVATALFNQALLYAKQERFAEAVPLFQRALAIRQEALGHDHPDVAAALTNLALVYRNIGRFTEAEALYERALPIWENSLGLDHPYLAIALENLASLRREQARGIEAEEIEARAKEVRARHEARNRRP